MTNLQALEAPQNKARVTKRRRSRRFYFRLSDGTFHSGSEMVVGLGTVPFPTADVPQMTRPDPVRNLMSTLAFLALTTVFLALIGAAAALKIPPRYAATTDIMIHMQQPGDTVVRYHASQSLIIKSPALLRPIAAANQLAYADLADDVSVDFPKGSNVMRVEVRNTDPQLATTILRSVMAAYDKSVAPIELDASASHQVISGPDLVDEPVFPVPSQFAAIGAALGLTLSMAILALGSWRRREQT